MDTNLTTEVVAFIFNISWCNLILQNILPVYFVKIAWFHLPEHAESFKSHFSRTDFLQNIFICLLRKNCMAQLTGTRWEFQISLFCDRFSSEYFYLSIVKKLHDSTYRNTLRVLNITFLWQIFFRIFLPVYCVKIEWLNLPENAEGFKYHFSGTDFLQNIFTCLLRKKCMVPLTGTRWEFQISLFWDILSS